MRPDPYTLDAQFDGEFWRMSVEPFSGGRVRIELKSVLYSAKRGRILVTPQGARELAAAINRAADKADS